MSDRGALLDHAEQHTIHLALLARQHIDVRRLKLVQQLALDGPFPAGERPLADVLVACRKLRERGIETSIVHARNDLYTAFGGRRGDLPNLDRFDRTYIALPCHLSIDEEDVAYITETIREGW